MDYDYSLSQQQQSLILLAEADQLPVEENSYLPLANFPIPTIDLKKTLFRLPIRSDSLLRLDFN